VVTVALACLYALRRRLLIATVSGFSMAPTLHLPPGWFAILGDSPEASRDSRDYGLVAQERLVGIVIRPIGRRREGSRSDA
jgi:type IV secretory pathway protease TraF